LTSATTGGPFTAQITRGDAEALGIKAGETVYVRATRVPAIAGDVQQAGAETAGEDQELTTA
jgi:sulfate transport system ATP-binding protein